MRIATAPSKQLSSKPGNEDRSLQGVAFLAWGERKAELSLGFTRVRFLVDLCKVPHTYIQRQREIIPSLDTFAG